MDTKVNCLGGETASLAVALLLCSYDIILIPLIQIVNSRHHLYHLDYRR